MCKSENIIFRFATESDTKDVINLWNQCFPDDSGFNEYFFSTIYKPQYNLLLFKNNILCSMAQMLPYKLQNGDKVENITYIYGACTHKDYRRQHLMDKLLNKSFQIDKENGVSASILIPQEKWLFDFYKLFGYSSTFMLLSHEETCYLNIDKELYVRQAEVCDIESIDKLYYENISFKTYINRDFAFWKTQIEMFKNCKGEVLCVYDKDELVCYAFVWLYENSFFCQEAVFKSKYSNACIANIQKHFKTPNCKISSFQIGKSDILGCMKRYDLKNTNFGYINLMLN